MYEVARRGVVECTQEIFTRAWNGTDGVYFSWDTDSIDSSCMPGTTAPECFGLKGREIVQLARTAGTFGADIMEVSELCPTFDVSQISIKTATLMICHFLGSRAKTLRDRGMTP
jgi:agmatinase